MPDPFDGRRPILPLREALAHRDGAPTCSSCQFSAPMQGQPNLSCRRHPPVVAVVKLKTVGMPAGLDIGGMVPEEMLQALTNFPSVQPTEWCGEYERGPQPTAVDS